MKKFLTILFISALVISCGKDKKEDTDSSDEVTKNSTAISFTDSHFEQKSTMPCSDKCTEVVIDIPRAEGDAVTADTINNKIFNVVRGIVYFGEKPTNASSYEEMMASFIKSYEDLRKEFPNEAIPWEAKIKGSIDYKSDSIINIKLNNYTYTGGAHGYEGNRSLLFDPATGHSLERRDIFKNEKGFTDLAEKKFRQKYNIKPMKSINDTGLFFPEEKFVLPENIFFKEDGVLLLYNPVEVGSFADGTKDVFISYEEAAPYLKRK